jgi:hypothetical protein
METAGVVGKTKEQFFPQHLAKRLLAFRTVPTGPAAVNQRNNKTGHFTCYKNRTFSFATDTRKNICLVGYFGFSARLWVRSMTARFSAKVDSLHR